MDGLKKGSFAPEIATRLLHHMRTPATSLLSERELQVLALVARGASNKEAARSLSISEATIKSHCVFLTSSALKTAQQQ